MSNAEAMVIVMQALVALASAAEERGEMLTVFRNEQLELLTYEQLSEAAAIVAALA